MIHIQTRVAPAHIAGFVLQSTLEYPRVDGMDARLACWLAGDGTWAIASVQQQRVGIACMVPLLGAPYDGFVCLYWLEVLPRSQRGGVGQHLLAWALAQAPTYPFVIAATPASATFYRRHPHLHEIQPNQFVRRATAVPPLHIAEERGTAWQPL